VTALLTCIDRCVAPAYGSRMRFTRWDGDVPAAALILLAVALVGFSTSGWNPETTGLIGMGPILLLVLAIGVVLGSRTCWATAFVLTGIWTTLLGMDLVFDLFRQPAVEGGPAAAALIPWAVQFAVLLALHPRWNARWAEAPSR
jgi:hypothetical protein